MLKVVSTHVVLPAVLALVVTLSGSYNFLLNIIAQTVVAIVFFAGYGNSLV